MTIKAGAPSRALASPLDRSGMAGSKPGETDNRSGPRYLVIGRVAKPWGMWGEVKVEVMTDFPDRFSLLRKVYLGPEAVPFALKGFRLHKGAALLKLEGCHDRTTVEKLRGQLVQIPIEEAIPLEQDEYYEHQIVGLAVWTAGGEYLGKVDEVISTGANDVYLVRGEGREVLIPAIEDVVLEINLAQGRMVVELMEGLI
ncbi:MAG: 16S rRNA processing protein RimM [Anaerolineales bacterium]|nr:16S rRNA processing protein RimM [Anaerolineales bacterium]